MEIVWLFAGVVLGLVSGGIATSLVFRALINGVAAQMKGISTQVTQLYTEQVETNKLMREFLRASWTY